MAKAGGPSTVPEGFHPLADEWADIEARERALRIAPGSPILVRPDGEVDYRVTEYLTRSSDFTGGAVDSQRTYAQEMATFFGFLSVAGGDGVGVEWDEATEEDFVAYRTWRLYHEDNDLRVEPATFQKGVAALNKFYDWAVSKGHVERSPVPAGKLPGSPGAFVKNAASSRDKWVMPRTYAMWRGVGLLDRQAALTDDREVVATQTKIKGARGRNHLRNTTYTDLLLTTALRNRELAHLFTLELPDSGSSEAVLPATLGKGARSRAWMALSPHALRGVDRYISQVRRAQVQAARAAGTYEGGHWLVVTTEDAPAGQVRGPRGGLRALASFTVEERPRLILDGPEGREPLMLWLTETGTPVDDVSWKNVFTKANDRVASEYRRLGLRSKAPTITAHGLRFTCALFTLLAFVQTIDERLGIDPSEPWQEGRYVEAFDYVREFLGHANETTTKDIYLKPVRDLRRQAILGTDRTLPNLMEWLASESPDVFNPRGDL